MTRQHDTHDTPATEPAKRSRPWLFEWWDTGIIVLAALSLVIIVFDSFYRFTPLPWLLQHSVPALDTPAHWLSRHASIIDGWFIGIFWLDILAGWLVAIVQRRYHRWFFYPFVHWYDVLGSLPITNLRWFRILRIVGLMVRLQKSGSVDFTQWRFFKFFHKYYDILMEELSDRVAVKLLGSVQADIQRGNGLGERIMQEVIAPQRSQLAAELAHQLTDLLARARDNNREDIERYLTSSTHSVLAQHASIKALKALPLGTQLSQSLENALTDVLKQLLDETSKGLSSQAFEQAIERIVDDGVGQMMANPVLTEGQFNQVLVDMLEVLKQEVAVKQWKSIYADDQRAQDT